MQNHVMPKPSKKSCHAMQKKTCKTSYYSGPYIDIRTRVIAFFSAKTVRNRLFFNEPILFQVDSTLIQYCRDFEPFSGRSAGWRVRPGDKDGEKFSRLSGQGQGARQAAVLGRKTENFAEERSLREVGKLAVLGSFSAQKGAVT